MGRTDFVNDFYKPAIEEINRVHGTQSGRPQIKISLYSDEWREGGDFAGMIVYKRGGKFTWTNNGGRANGQKGRFMYVAIQDTTKWPEGSIHKRWGQGRVHGYLLKDVLGLEQYADSSEPIHPEGDVYGGFAVRNGVCVFSSIWLNGNGEGSDGDKLLSSLEQRLIEHVVAQWKLQGKHKRLEVPASLHDQLMGSQ